MPFGNQNFPDFCGYSMLRRFSTTFPALPLILLLKDDAIPGFDLEHLVVGGAEDHQEDCNTIQGPREYRIQAKILFQNEVSYDFVRVSLFAQPTKAGFTRRVLYGLREKINKQYRPSH